VEEMKNSSQLILKQSQIREKLERAKTVISNLEDDIANISTEIWNKKERLQQLKRETDRLNIDDEVKEVFKTLPGILQELLDFITRETELAESKWGKNIENFDRIVKEFEERARQIAQIENILNDSEGTLERINENFKEIMEEWKPQMQKMVEIINDQFASLFYQLNGLTGDVRLEHNEQQPDDVSLWQISIRVQFRKDESAHLLTHFRQSGGEKSVTTILYLLAMQSLAKTPFRVVDEINQGMDVRNERLIHKLIVNNSVSSQYQDFLITPKLLTDLDYAEHMNILCVYSGNGVLI
jgi:structural maintenance of chromosomes protein 5